LLEPHGIQVAAAVDELRRHHAAGAHRLAVRFQRLVDHREAVAGAQAMEIDVGGEDVHQLAGDGVRDPGLVHGLEQRAADAAAAHAQGGDQRRRLDAAGEAAGRLAFHHQALESPFVAGPAHRQAQQVAAVGGLGADLPAGGAQHLRARHGVLAQEGGRGGIVDAQAGQQGFRGVGGADRFGREQAEVVGVERFGLLLQRQGLHGLEDLTHRQGGGVRAERGHGIGAPAHGEEEGGYDRRDLSRVVLQHVACTCDEPLPGGQDILVQRLRPRSCPGM
jgi:hypothetical protein